MRENSTVAASFEPGDSEYTFDGRTPLLVPKTLARASVRRDNVAMGQGRPAREPVLDVTARLKALT